MRYLIITLTILTLSSCTYERIYIGDVEKLLNVQLKNNEQQIQRIKQDIIGFKLDKIRRNSELIQKLERLHTELLVLNDTIELLSKDQAANKAKAFTDKNFNDIEYYENTPLEITEEIPRPLLKLHLATMEGFYLKEQEGRYSFADYRISLDKLHPLIVPDRIVYKQNEKITGRILLMSTTDDPKLLVQNAKLIKKLEINGIQIGNEKGLGRFEIQIQNNTKPGELLLTTWVTLPDTILKAETEVYVRD